MVLAAGMGSRFGSLKQLDGMGPSGETIIDYSVYDAVRAGFNKVVFVIRKDFEDEFKEKVSNKYKSIVQVEHVYQDLNDIPEGFTKNPERSKPWGTGHAVWVAKDVINEPYAVINADDFYGQNSFEMMAEYLKSLDASDISKQCMIGYQIKNTLSDNGSVSRGVCEVNEASDLDGITERTEIYRSEGGIVYKDNDVEHALHEDTIVSMNMFGFTPATFEYYEKDFKTFLEGHSQTLKGEFYMPIVVNNLIKNNLATLKVLPTTSQWFGVTYKEDKPVVVQKIQELVNQGIYPAQLWN